DFAGAYRTMDADYTESVVWCFAELYRKGLVYEGQKVVAYCTRCQTALSNFETRLDDAYRPREDLAVTVRFPSQPGPPPAVPTMAPASFTSRLRSARTIRRCARHTASPVRTRCATTARSTRAPASSRACTCSRRTSRSRAWSPRAGGCLRAAASYTSIRTAGA